MKAFKIIFWVGYVYALYLATPLDSFCTENAVCVQEMLRELTAAFFCTTICYFLLFGLPLVCMLIQDDDKKEKE